MGVAKRDMLAIVAKYEYIFEFLSKARYLFFWSPQ